MHILVLDTIHGGKGIADSLSRLGHSVDMVDVYREEVGITPRAAEQSEYDLMVAPVHLNPAYPLLQRVSAPVVTHHQAVRWIIGTQVPRPFVEITGARGKTTTAHALAHLMTGPGVLHSSRGTVTYPSCGLHAQGGITPASLLGAVGIANSLAGWMVAEISLGYIGSGQLGILTSMDSYRFAGGRKDAREEKIRSGLSLPCLITPPGSPREGNRIPADDIACVTSDTCRYKWEEIRGEFSNPLFQRDGYRDSLAMAAAAACILGIDPSPLATFPPLKGRMDLSRAGETMVVDDSNSGTCALTARQAIRLARQQSGQRSSLTLVIGKEEGAICDGFPAEDVITVIRLDSPDRVVLVGKDYYPQIPSLLKHTIRFSCCNTLAEGRDIALREAGGGMVVLAVKTWR